MIKKDNKLNSLRRQYEAQNIFYYEPEIFFTKIDLLRQNMEDYYELISGIKFLEKNVPLIQELYRITEHVEHLIYKFTNKSIKDDVSTQDELFGEQADCIVEILPVMTTEDVGLLITDEDKELDGLLEDLQEKISGKVESIQEVASDLSHMLTRSF